MLTDKFFADYKALVGESFFNSIYKKREGGGDIPEIFKPYFTYNTCAHFHPSPTTCGVGELIGVFGTFAGALVDKEILIKKKVFSALLKAVTNNRGLMLYYQPRPIGQGSTLNTVPLLLEAWGFKQNSETFYNPNSGNTLGEWRIYLLHYLHYRDKD